MFPCVGYRSNPFLGITSLTKEKLTKLNRERLYNLCIFYEGTDLLGGSCLRLELPQATNPLIASKGRTIRKVMGGGGGEFSACTNFFFAHCFCRNFFFLGEPLCTNFFYYV